MQTVQATGKTLDEALTEAAAQLGLPKEALDYELIGEPKRLLGVLGTGQYTVRAWAREIDAEPPEESEEEPLSPETEPPTPAMPSPPPPLTGEATPQVMAERAQEIVQHIIQLMGLEARIEVTSAAEEHLQVRIDSPEAQGLLIGHHGETLDALQYLVTIGVNAGLTGVPFRVLLDVGDYRAQQAEALSKLAHRHADEAIASGREAVMPGLRPYERRIVHLALKEREDVETYSEGEDPDRQLVISPLVSPEAESTSPDDDASED